ncbi:MAG: hypothetical protein AAFY10_15025, partial [Pseudomonadota bacterium]
TAIIALLGGYSVAMTLGGVALLFGLGPIVLDEVLWRLGYEPLYLIELREHFQPDFRLDGKPGADRGAAFRADGRDIGALESRR